MKTKIKKILLENLTSNYDEGDIDNGGIIGGDNTVDELYDFFVDEISKITIEKTNLKPPTLEIIKNCNHPKEFRSYYSDLPPNTIENNE
jgi:hypothetical protein